jgi:hypothetical protein
VPVSFFWSSVLYWSCHRRASVRQRRWDLTLVCLGVWLNWSKIHLQRYLPPWATKGTPCCCCALPCDWFIYTLPLLPVCIC